MQSIRPHVERAGGRSRFLCLILLLSCTAPAYADEADAFNFFVGSNVTRDDNVFRLAPDSNTEIIPGSKARADTITMTYAGGSFKKQLGRQRVWMDVNLNQSRYDLFSFLNFDGGSGAAGWDWRLGNLLSGRMGTTYSRQMAGFADLRRTVQNLYDDEAEYASIDFMMHPDWHLESEARHSTRTFDNAANQASNTITDQWKLGVRYTPRDGSFLLLRAITVDGRLPNQQVIGSVRIDNSYEQSELGIEFGTSLNGLSRISGLLAEVRREHQNVPERDFRGLVGNIGWDWAVTGKTTLSGKLRREIGATNDLQSSYILTDGINLGMSWQPTAKITARLNYDRAYRDYAGDPFRELAGLQDRSDRVDSLSLSVNYQVMTSLSLSFNLTRSERESNVPTLPFVATSAMIGAQIAF